MLGFGFDLAIWARSGGACPGCSSGLPVSSRAGIERNGNGAIVRLTNPVALWSIPTAQAVRALKEDTAAFFYVDQRSGARVLIQLRRGQAGEELVGAVPGLAEGLPLP